MRSYDDFNVIIESHEEPQQALDRELPELAAEHLGDIGLGHAEQLARFDLLQAAILENSVDFVDELRLDQVLFGVRHTQVLEFNHVAQLEEAFALHGADIACVIIEPIAGNMNFVRATVPFIRRLRELCTQHGALLVFDEVMTGFRVALGGAQSLYARAIPGFEPDMSVFGKVIGGGMPLAAFGARRAVMEQLAPLGPVYQAGTLSGNPVATACGLATLHEIAKPGFFDALAARTRSLVGGLLGAAREAGVTMAGDSEGGMFGFFFAGDLPQHYGAVMATDKERFNRFFHAMLERGVYFAPALYEAGFVSAAHAAEDIAATVEAARAALRS